MFPDRVALTTFAENEPEASLTTIVLTVFDEVAVVLALGSTPATSAVRDTRAELKTPPLVL